MKNDSSVSGEAGERSVDSSSVGVGGSTDVGSVSGARSHDGGWVSNAVTRRSVLRTGGAGALALAAGSAYVGTAAGSIPTPRLWVDGKYVVDPSGNRVKLRGFSIADPHWYDSQVAWLGKSTEDLLSIVTDESRGWYPSHVRLPVTQDSVSEAGGYDSYIQNHLRPAVDFLGEQGVYALVDNHIIRPYTAEATDAANDSYDQYPDALVREFWNAVAPEFADDDHVIYELFNEPIGPRDNGLQSWNTWRETAQPWVDLLQDHAPATPVVVGSPMWCQMTNYAHLNPFVHDNVIYAAHIYTQEYMRPWEEYFGDTVADVPFINSEWGWDATSDSQVDDGTRDGYGQPLMDWMESHDNVHWTAWCMDPEWGPTMIDVDDSQDGWAGGGWYLLSGNDHHGQFIKDQLAATQNDLIPQVSSGETPFSGGVPADSTAPPAPGSVAVDRVTEEIVDLSWEPVTDAGDAGLYYYALYVDGTLQRRLADTITSTSLEGLSPNTSYEFAITAVDRAGNESSAASTTTTTLARNEGQSAYTTLTAPGRIQVEDFDQGGNGIAYYDTTPGNNGGLYRETDVDIESRSENGHSIGWVSDGEWWEYTVDVQADASYTIYTRFASGEGGGQMRIEVDGEEVASTNVWNTGGWGTWTELNTGQVDLTAGEHLVRITAVSGGWNFDWFEFEAQGDINVPDDGTAPTAPTGLSATTITGISVDLTWTASTDEGGSGLDHYAVSVDGQQDHTVPAGSTSTTVSGLQSATTYTVALSAVDGAGNESPSTTIDVTTMEGEGGDMPPVDGSVPGDLDGDGVYMDVNGNGRLDNDDVVTYFENMNDAAISNNVAAFDYNGNSRIDFDDLVTLFESL